MQAVAPSTDASSGPVEVAWFSALCDDDYEFLGVPDPALRSSWEHCRDITLAADRNGFDNILLPSGYTLGIDSVAFAGGVAPLVEQIQLLVAVRCGELWVPQLARQLATIDRMLGGRLTINIISSDRPGETVESEPRYRRTLETMQALRTLLDGEPLTGGGEFVDLHLDPPSVTTVSGRCPPFYFGGMSEPAREVAAEAADVFLMWPDTLPAVESLLTDMRGRAERHGRALRFGYRVHVIVRETEAEARDAAVRLVSRLDDGVGDEIRQRSLDSASASAARPSCGWRPATRAMSRTTCGPVSAGPAAGAGRRSWAIPIRCWPSSRPIGRWASRRSSSRATRTSTNATCSPDTSFPVSTTADCSTR